MPHVARQNVLNPHWLCAVLTAVPVLLAAVVVAVAALLP
jgi:hypothetical protein